jgi:predicted short-subunit dehydrogenase-like oxidoreductase (DUF2520 family)
MNTHQDIIIIGTGNVATHLAIALKRSSYNLLGVVGRNHNKAKVLAEKVGCKAYSFEVYPNADIYIYAVSDSVIDIVAVQISKNHSTGIHIHTSGSVSIDVFEDKGFSAYGVLYPMQTFSANKSVDFSKIPLFIEGNDDNTTQVICTLANELSECVSVLNSEKRRFLHLIAVFTCNFANHCIAIGEKIAQDAGIDTKLFNPLIKETVDKLNYLSANDAQTGPAKRWDEHIMSLHLQMLEKYPDEQRIYQLLSENIHEYSKTNSKQ